MMQTAYDFSFTDIDSNPLPLAKFKGQALLVVNTASQCGFTKQYRPLQELQDRYSDRGFSVIGVPSDDFKQESGSDSEIKSFCETFRVTFPLTAKTHVRGERAHPFFTWASHEGGLFAAPKWNFHKFLIGKDGRLINWYFTTTSPLSRRITTALERELR